MSAPEEDATPMDVTPASTEETHAAPDDVAPADAVPSDEAETPRAVLGPAAAAAAQAMREAGAEVLDDATSTQLPVGASRCASRSNGAQQMPTRTFPPFAFPVLDLVLRPGLGPHPDAEH